MPPTAASPSNQETQARAGGTETMQVLVNGEPRSVPAGSTVSGLLEALELGGERLAVEVDREIVRRPFWDSHTLRPGAAVEVVHFVGGG